MAKKATAEKETKTTKTATKTVAKTEDTEVKTAAKTTAKTTKAAKAKEPVIKVTLEYQGKNVVMRSIVDSVIEAYKAEGNSDAIETLDVYVQPENNVAYYVINGKEEGKSVSF